MDVLMPQLGETVAEGKITNWFKAIGDTIAPGDVLFEIETDKTSMEVPSIEGGVLRDIRVPAGAVAPVGAVVGIVAAAGEAIAPARPAAAPAPASPKPNARQAAAAPIAQPAPTRELTPFNDVPSPTRNFGAAKLANGTRTTPLARRLAAQAGIDLSNLNGSGPRGRIVAADINAARAKAPAAPAMATGASADQVKALYTGTPYEEVPLDNMRRVIAQRLQESKQTVPHFYLTLDVAMDSLLDLRRQYNEGAVKISVNDMVVKAYALALRRTPDANAAWASDRILRFKTADVGVAVSIEGGLYTPVIRNADGKSLQTISAEIRDLAKRAKDRKLKPQEYQGGAATVSNLGMFGVKQFSAIINPPQATILAVGASEKRPVESKDGGIRLATMMTVTLAADHRVVDGALAAKVLAAFKAIIESPAVAMLQGAE